MIPGQHGNAASFPLIISTDMQKTDPETRKLIRSHVMRGKNRVKPSRKSKQLSRGVPPRMNLSYTNDPFSAVRIPKSLCSKFSAIGFAAEVEPALVEDVLLFASMSSKAMFMLDKCIEPVTSDMRRTWFAPMLSDAAYLYTACFTIQTFFDGLLVRARSAESLQRDRIYYGKAIRMLQERLALDDDSIRLSDSTIMTVLSLSGHAYTTGDFEVAGRHIDGLLKLVSMRGVDSFSHNTRILIEIIRSDLSMAIDSGRLPTLCSVDSIPWALMRNRVFEIESGDENCPQSQGVAVDMCSSLNSGLADIWVAVSEFCTVVNAAAEGNGPLMSEEAFLHRMGSITYRLLFQRFEDGSLDEAFRLGLLAFLSPIFLHWNRVELPDRRFNDTYQEALTNLVVTHPELQPQKRLWLFMVGALSMSHEPDRFNFLRTWLAIDMALCCIESWDEMTNLLSSMLWVGLVYDSPGKKIFESLLSE